MSVEQAYKGKSGITTRCEIIRLMIGLTEEQNGYSHRADGFKSGTLILKGGGGGGMSTEERAPTGHQESQY